MGELWSVSIGQSPTWYKNMSRDFLSVSFYSLAEGSPAFKSRVPQPMKMRYNSSTTCASHVIIRFSINMSALTSPPPLCDVLRVNPRHLVVHSGFQYIVLHSGIIAGRLSNVYCIGNKAIQAFKHPWLKGDPGRVTLCNSSV